MMDAALNLSKSANSSRSVIHRFTLLALCSACSICCLAATPWFPFGPDGGDARAFAADPHDHTHLYLGAANGWIYDSHNGGQSWKRLARVGNRDDLVIDNILVDPADSKHVLAGTWVLGSVDGGLFVSNDGGDTWTSNPEMQHESIRALAAAPSDPKIIIAGTLEGVLRSSDNGVHWKLISPAGSTEIHEVESIAIDPSNPQIIYAGTWHLPWKSSDGGANWHNIKQGIIEDSDVFSIIVDPKQPNVVYASACSGIYKSENGGEQFAKIQGIPTTARRTRVLMQDPSNLTTVFAGTTEGLFRTTDAGSIWIRTTADDVIINDIYVDPANSQHVLMATDRGGVLTSNDGGNSFTQTNAGFSSRQIVSYVADAQHPAEIYVGVANDKQWGGVFYSSDGGLAWSQRAEGLDGRDVFSLAQAANGTIVAGTEHGLFVFEPASQRWKRGGEILPPPPPEKPKRGRGARAVKAEPPVVHKAVARHDLGMIEGAVMTLSRSGDQLYAVTSDGVFSVDDPARPWSKVEGLPEEPWRYLAASDSKMLLASLHSLTLSTDSGKTWHAVPVTQELTQIGAVAIDGSGNLWAGGREGIYFSTDNGATWSTSKGLFVNGVNNIFYDKAGDRLLVTANGSSTFAFSLHLPDQTMKYWDTGWNLRFMRPVGDYLVGITRFDGVVVEPRMVPSKPQSAALLTH
jgi:photosystem II stability/assembly factor-like uncharacterized protein